MTTPTLDVQVPVDDGAIQQAFETLDVQMDAWLHAMKRAEEGLRESAREQTVAATASISTAGPAEDTAEGANVVAEVFTGAVAEPTTDQVEEADSGEFDDESVIARDVALATDSSEAAAVEDAPAVSAMASDVPLVEADEEAIAEAAEPAAEATQETSPEAIAPSAGDSIETNTETPAEPVTDPVAATTPADVISEPSVENLPADAAMPEPAVESEPTTPSAPAGPSDEELLATLDEDTAKAIRVMRRMCMNTKSVRQLLDEYQAQQATQVTSGPQKKSRWWRGK